MINNGKASSDLKKEFLEGPLEDEVEAHTEGNVDANRKNGKCIKKLKAPVGAVDIAPAWDRNGTFEPAIFAKRNKALGVDLDPRSSRGTAVEPVTVISGIISGRRRFGSGLILPVPYSFFVVG